MKFLISALALKALIYAALGLAFLGLVVLLTLLYKDFKNRSIW